MQSGIPPKRARSLVYEELKEKSPWTVMVDEHAVGQVAALVRLHPNLESFFTDRLLGALKIFPPDSKYFSDPEMSWGNPTVWVTISEHHLRIRVKAEYRQLDGICWVVEIHAASQV